MPSPPSLSPSPLLPFFLRTDQSISATAAATRDFGPRGKPSLGSARKATAEPTAEPKTATERHCLPPALRLCWNRTRRAPRPPFSQKRLQRMKMRWSSFPEMIMNLPLFRKDAREMCTATLMQRVGEKMMTQKKRFADKKRIKKKINQSSNSAHSGIFMTVALDAVSRSLSHCALKSCGATEEHRRLMTFDVQKKKFSIPLPPF